MTENEDKLLNNTLKDNTFEYFHKIENTQLAY